MSPLPLFVTFLCVVGASFLGAALLRVRSERQDLSRRTDLVAYVPRAHRPRRVGILPRLARRNELIRAIFAFGLPYRWGMHAGPGALLLAGLGGATAVGFLLYGLLHLPPWIAVIACAAAFVLAPRQLLKHQQDETEQVFLNLFPDALDMVVRMVRAGLPVMSAVRSVGREAPAPVGGVFAAVADRIEVGATFEDAVLQAGDQIGLADFRFFAVAISLQYATGGNIAQTLEVLAEIIRKRRAARLKAKSTTSEVRLSAYILGALPFVVVAGLLIFAPSYLAPLVRDPRGNIIVGAAIISLSLGFLMIRELMRRATRL